MLFVNTFARTLYLDHHIFFSWKVLNPGFELVVRENNGAGMDSKLLLIYCKSSKQFATLNILFYSSSRSQR